jgi:ABC-2 type transport system ATP-binding protein
MTLRSGIEVVGATKVIDGVTVLDDVSFTAVPGRITAFLGPNGAGKSTLLRAILGIDRLSSGHATVAGQAVRDHPQPLRVVGALVNPDAVHPRRTVRGHLEVAALSNGLPRSTATRALEFTGLGAVAEVPTGQLSLGMRQRLGLAVAFLGDPEVVVLDEPHNGLDTAAIRWLRLVLRSFADAGRTVLIASHLMSELESFADDVVVIDGGRLASAASLDVFLRAGGTRRSLEESYLDLVGSR